MASKIEELIKTPIVNFLAPVEVIVRDLESNEKSVKFKTLSDFEKWYVPKRFNLLGAQTSDKLNLIMLDVKPGAAKAEKVAAKLAQRPKQQPVPPAKAKDKGNGQAPKVPTVAPKAAPKAVVGGGASVWADGKEHRSVLVAFEALGLPIKAHKKFRAELKAKRKLVFVDGKRKVQFEYR